MNKLIVLVCSIASLFMTLMAQAAEPSPDIDSQLPEAQPVATTVAEWLKLQTRSVPSRRESPLTENPDSLAQAPDASVQITDLQVNSTETGIEVILQTAGEIATPVTSTEAEDAIQVVVTGEQEEGYAPSDATTATRTDTPLRDIPQSIQVVPQQVIEDQGITRITDAVRNVSGVTVQRDIDQTVDSYNIRGFAIQNFLIDGVASPFSFFVPPRYNVERVEVLKGTASVLYGQLEPGGIVNYVTEQPLSEPYYAAEFTIGSYDFYEPSIDISGPLTDDRRLLYRLNAAYQSAGSFVDFVNQDSFVISPALTYRIGDTTTIGLRYDYINTTAGYYARLPTDPRSFDAPRNRFLGEPDRNDCQRWNSDDWGGYERVLPTEIEHYIGKDSTQRLEHTNGIVRQQTGKWHRRQNKFGKLWEQTKVTARLVVSYFNWIWQHSRFKTTAAQRAGLTDRCWSWHDIAIYPTII